MDRPLLFYRLPAINEIKMRTRTVHPMVAIACNLGKISVFLGIGLPVREEIRVRWDEQATAVEKWNGAVPPNSLSSTQPVSFLQNMATASRLHVQVTPITLEPLDFSFDVSSFRERVETIKTNCGDGWARGALEGRF